METHPILNTGSANTRMKRLSYCSQRTSNSIEKLICKCTIRVYISETFDIFARILVTMAAEQLPKSLEPWNNKNINFPYEYGFGARLGSTSLSSSHSANSWGAWRLRTGTAWRYHSHAWRSMLASGWDFIWGCGPEHLQVASPRGRASSQHGDWVSRASILREKGKQAYLLLGLCLGSQRKVIKKSSIITLLLFIEAVVKSLPISRGKGTRPHLSMSSESSRTRGMRNIAVVIFGLGHRCISCMLLSTTGGFWGFTL